MSTEHPEPEARGLRVAARVLVDLGLEAHEALDVDDELEQELHATPTAPKGRMCGWDRGRSQ